MFSLKLLSSPIFKMLLQNIRKFGLKYCDLETTIWNIDVMMRILAINIDVRNSNPTILNYVIMGILLVSYYYVYVISATWFLCGGSQESIDLVTAVRIFSVSVTSHVSVVKLWFICIYQKSVKDVVAEYLSCNAEVDPGNRFDKNLNSTLRIVKKRALVFGFVILFNAILFLIIPIFKRGRHMPEETFVFIGLEPMLESPNYEIAKFLSGAAIFISGYVPTPICGFYVILSGYTEAYMLALSKELETIWDDAQEYYKKNKSEVYTESDLFQDEDIDEYIKKRLETIMKGHRTNVNLIAKLEEVFRTSILIGYFFLITGLIADLLAGLENTFIQMPYSLFIVGMDCLAGQRLMDANVIFESAVYACNWENFNPSNRKKVLLLLTNSQKTMSLTAGTITTLSYETYMNIIKSIYSAYTTLHSTMSTKKN